MTLIRKLAQGTGSFPDLRQTQRAKSPETDSISWERVRGFVILRLTQMVMVRRGLVHSKNLEERTMPREVFWAAHTLNCLGSRCLLLFHITLSVSPIMWFGGSMMGPGFPSRPINKCWEPILTKCLPCAGTVLSCPWPNSQVGIIKRPFHR